MNGDRSVDINTFGKYVEGVNDIAQSWYIILHTLPGSDPLRQTFGSNVYQYLDKPNNSFGGSFASQVINDLEKWETRAKISQVTTSIGENNNILISILGVYTETNALISVTFSIT